MLAFFTLVGLAFVGPVVSPFMPLLATEAMAVFYCGELGMNPWLVGLACMIGQNLAYIVLYYSGAALTDRWARLKRQIDWLRVRYSGARRTFVITWLCAAFFGVPPALPVVLLARGFSMRLTTLLAIGLPLRLLRFTLLAAVGSALWPAILDLWHRFWG